MVFQAITGAQTPACLLAASDPVETVTPPWCGERSPVTELLSHFGAGSSDGTIAVAESHVGSDDVGAMETLPDFAPSVAELSVERRWLSPGAAVASALIPGLGQAILGHRRMAGMFFALICAWVMLFFPPFRLPATYAAWIGLIFGGWGLAIAASCQALRSTGHGKRPGRFAWLVCMVPLAVSFPFSFHFVTLRCAGFEGFRIAGTSMEPELRPGDVLMTDMWFYRNHSPAEGELAVLRSPRTPGVIIVKRIIAVGGDTISSQGGVVRLNGRTLNEPFVQHTGMAPAELMTFGPVPIPAHKVFVMGDSRDVSLDSRIPEFGLVDDSALLGKPLYVVRFGREHPGERLR